MPTVRCLIATLLVLPATVAGWGQTYVDDGMLLNEPPPLAGCRPAHEEWGAPSRVAQWLAQPRPAEIAERPYYVGWQLGGIFGDELTADLTQGDDVVAVYLAGWELHPSWSAEVRWQWAHLPLVDATGPLGTSADQWNLDGSLLYFPWPHRRLRPYVSVGLGFSGVHFEDAAGWERNDVTLGLPIGCGLKYDYLSWLTLRLDFRDNIALGGDYGGRHNLSLTGGAEIRFGGRPKRSYFPWR